MRNFGGILAMAGICFASPAIAGFGIPVEINGVSRPAGKGPIFLLVQRGSAADGATKQDILRITCAANQFRSATLWVNKAGPPWPESGGIRNRRLRDAVGIPRKWRNPTPRLRVIRPVLPATLLSAPADRQGWVAVSLANAEDLCPAAAEVIR